MPRSDDTPTAADLDPEMVESFDAMSHLVQRSGGSEMTIGWTCNHDRRGGDDLPDEHLCDSIVWYVSARFQHLDGHRLEVFDPSPKGAADAMAEAILSDGYCRCGRRVTLDGAGGLGAEPECFWSRTGDRWESSCDAPPMPIADARRMAEEASR